MTAADDRPPLRVGRILRPHGVLGAVVVEPLTDFGERFAPGSRLESERGALTVESARTQGGCLVVRFAEIKDRDAADRCRDQYLTVPLAEAYPLPADHFYHFQLIGLRVVQVGSEKELGQVAEILPYPANDVLRVIAGQGEVLIPMARAIIREIDLNRGRILVDLPEEKSA